MLHRFCLSSLPLHDEEDATSTPPPPPPNQHQHQQHQKQHKQHSTASNEPCLLSPFNNNNSTSFSCSTSPIVQVPPSTTGTNTTASSSSSKHFDILPIELACHILSFLELKLDWILRDHDSRNVTQMRQTVMHLLYGYKSGDKSRARFLIFPSISAPVDVRIARLWPTILLHFESFKEMCSRLNTEWWRMDFVFHQQLHRLYFRDVKLSFDIMRGDLSGLLALNIVDCWIDDRGLGNLLTHAKHLQRLHLINNPDLSATAVSNHVSKHKCLKELRFNPFYSRRDSIQLDKLLSCPSLTQVDLMNSAIGRFKGEGIFESSKLSKFMCIGHFENSSDVLSLEKLKNLEKLQLDAEQVPTFVLLRLFQQLNKLQEVLCYMGDTFDRSELMMLIAQRQKKAATNLQQLQQSTSTNNSNNSSSSSNIISNSSNNTNNNNNNNNSSLRLLSVFTLEKTLKTSRAWSNYLPYISKLYIDSNFHDEDLLIFLNHNKVIQHIEMNRQFSKTSNLTFAAFHYISKLNNTLRVLKLHNVREDFKYSLRDLAKHPTLEKIVLSNCFLNTERVIDLLKQVVPSISTGGTSGSSSGTGTNLKHVKLEDVFEYDETLDAVIGKHPTLQVLKISQASIPIHLYCKLFQKKNLIKLHLPAISHIEMLNIPKNDTLQELAIGHGPVDGSLLLTLKDRCTALNMAPWFEHKTIHRFE